MIAIIEYTKLGKRMSYVGKITRYCNQNTDLIVFNEHGIINLRVPLENVDYFDITE